MFDSAHKENIKKTRETINPIVDTKRLCVSKYYIERSQRQQQKKHPEVELVVLLIQEILWNYYSLESREGTKTSFRMPHDIVWVYKFLLF